MALTCHWRRCGQRNSIFATGPAWGISRVMYYPLVLLGHQTETGKRSPMAKFLQQLWHDESGQDIAEYAVMLAVILVIVVGTIRLIGSNANNVFSQVGSSIQ